MSHQRTFGSRIAGVAARTGSAPAGSELDAHRSVPAASIRPESVPSRVRRGRPYSLAARFLVVNAVVVLITSVAIGLLVGQQIENGVINRTASLAALYVESLVEPQLQGLAARSALTSDEIRGLSGLLTETPVGQGIVSFKVWSTQGQVLYSPYTPLIGQAFDVDASLAQAVRGEVTAHLSDLGDPENVSYEQTHWTRLLETYVPVRARGTDRIVAVTEFYQLPDELEAEVGAARQRSWALVALVAVLSYLVLAGVVKQGSDTISRQEREMRSRVDELSRLLAQNARLDERVRHAAASSTTLNEQALRRVSADLHDGAGQALALALLRLDVARARSASRGADELEVDLTVVHDALADGLEDMRAVAAGIRLPELETRTLSEVAERAAEDHEERSGTPVDLVLRALPGQAPHPIKIALFRTLQEALSNATRHAGGVDVRVKLQGDGGLLRLEVSDGGSGFDPTTVPTAGHLGLAGMRERAELLGGSFRVESQPGHGTVVVASWPLGEGGAEWTAESA
jgi:signal transduction histidine kinase